MKFRIVIKDVNKTVAEVEGKDRDPRYVTMKDIADVLFIEQQLEKILGLRVHISEVI